MPAIPINIPKTSLEKLYLNKRLSTDAIGKIYSCTHATVLRYLKLYNIPRRSRLGNRTPVDIPKETLRALYVDKKLTQKQIARQYRHSRYGIQRWFKIYGIPTRSISETNTKYPKKNFSANKIEKAYLIGFRLGDLNIMKIKHLIQARCSSTIPEQAELFKQLFSPYTYVHIWKAPRGTYEMVALLNESFSFLLPKNDRIVHWILNNNKYFLSFFAGYADAEGSYYLKNPRKGVGKVVISLFEIQTYDKNLLLSAKRKLTSLKIDSYFSKSRSAGYIDKRGVKTNKDCWRIVINKKQSLWNYIKLIRPYHKHVNKIRNLTSVKENILLRNKLPYCRPISL